MRGGGRFIGHVGGEDRHEMEDEFWAERVATFILLVNGHLQW
jgi:hypothetical protein